MFCGTTTSTEPSSSTTWNATATVVQLRQLANAYASLRLSAVLLSTQTRAKETSYLIEPSLVLTASAWLSPPPGGSGRLNGKTQVGDMPPSPLDPAEPPEPPEPPEPFRGVSTRASAGCSAVGGCPASSG